MGIFEIGPKNNWRRLTTIAFVFLCLISLGFFSSIYHQFIDDNPDTNKTINLGIVWTLLLVVWLGFRYRYKQAKKEDNNRIKPN
jgi:hypothetical protein